MGMVQGADRGVTAAYWQVSPVSDGTTDTVTELLTGISQAGLISQSSNPLTLPSDYCTAAPHMQQWRSLLLKDTNHLLSIFHYFM